MAAKQKRGSPLNSEDATKSIKKKKANLSLDIDAANRYKKQQEGTATWATTTNDDNIEHAHELGAVNQGNGEAATSITTNNDDGGTENVIEDGECVLPDDQGATMTAATAKKLRYEEQYERDRQRLAENLELGDGSSTSLEVAQLISTGTGEGWAMSESPDQLLSKDCILDKGRLRVNLNDALMICKHAPEKSYVMRRLSIMKNWMHPTTGESKVTRIDIPERMLREFVISADNFARKNFTTPLITPQEFIRREAQRAEFDKRQQQGANVGN